jgi:hemerythrin
MKLSANEFDSQMREALSIFLREWLTRHVFGIDKELEAFILDSSQK